MKILVIRDKKTGKIDYISYCESGPLPSIINPPDPGSPKDEAPPWVKEKKKKIN